MRRAVAARPRTYLRKPTDRDADEFVSRVLTSRSHLEPWVHPAASSGAFAQWLTRGARADVEQFLVCTRAGDQIAGFLNLNNITRGGLQQAAAGWAAFLPFTGSGHLTEALDMGLELAFTQLRLHRVEANIQPGNDRSRALAIRSGFQLEGFSPRFLLVGGEWRDHERWAIDADRWREEHRSALA